MKEKTALIFDVEKFAVHVGPGIRPPVFLCGPGGEYITGQLIRLDGGEQLSPC